MSTTTWIDTDNNIINTKKLTVVMLKAMAKERKLKGYSKLRKEQLLDFLFKRREYSYKQEQPA